MKIFLDDERYPINIGYDDSWTIARNLKELSEICINTKEDIIISFDHDLGMENIDGFTCAQWMIDNNYIPKTVIVHSKNPVGAKRILNTFKSYSKYFDVNIEIIHHLW